MMKNQSKRLRTALIVAAAGLTIALTSAFLFGSALTTSLDEHNESFPLSKVGSVVTDVQTADLIVRAIEGNEITVRWFDSEKRRLSVSADDGTLVLRGESVIDSIAKSLTSFSIFTPNERVELGIPAGFMGEMTLGVSTGDITVSNMRFEKDARLTSATGSITLSNIIFGGKASLQTTTGDIAATEIEALGDLSVSQSTGQIKGDHIKADQLFELRHSTGDTHLTEVAARRLTADASTGSIEISPLNIGQSLRVTTSTGDIKCSLTDGIQNYTIKSHTATGDNTLPQELAGGEKELYAAASTGSINITFNVR